jgi:hypothetical protein
VLRLDMTALTAKTTARTDHGRAIVTARAPPKSR